MPGTLMRPEDSRAKTSACSDTVNLVVCSTEDRCEGHQKVVVIYCSSGFVLVTVFLL